MATITPIGQINGKDICTVTLSGAGLRVCLMTWGARLTELWVPDSKGAPADIVLGCDSLADWQAHGTYLGATCGRYANRIAGGLFVLDGRRVQVDQNEAPNHLHGGSQGFDQKVWEISSHDADHVTFVTQSDDGEMGYPGAVQAQVTYRISGLGLHIDMTATTDAPTVVNMVNHAYFNLAGQGHADVMGQHLQVEAGHYLPVNAQLIPTGEVRPVAGTAFDFRQSRAIGALLPDAEGFDHNLCLASPLGADGLRDCLVATDPASGRRLRLRTTEPGLQLYTGAHFNGGPGKARARYPRFAGFAVETQRFPDSPNHPHFPPARLLPGETYLHQMRFDLAPV